MLELSTVLWILFEEFLLKLCFLNHGRNETECTTATERNYVFSFVGHKVHISPSIPNIARFWETRINLIETTHLQPRKEKKTVWLGTSVLLKKFRNWGERLSRWLCERWESGYAVKEINENDEGSWKWMKIEKDIGINENREKKLKGEFKSRKNRIIEG